MKCFNYLLLPCLLDSSENVCIENSTVNMGHDAISLKSGWDEYGIAYSRPTENVHIRNVNLGSAFGSSISFGSEMSGGISNVLVENALIQNSLTGTAFRTTKGRGGYMKDIDISNIDMSRIGTAFVANGSFGSHPDDKYDANALPVVSRIRLSNVSGVNIGVAGIFFGIEESPFRSVALTNVSLSMSSSSNVSWQCSYVYGSSKSVIPEPCPELKRVDDSAYLRAAV